MKTAASPKGPPPALSDLAHLENLLDSLLILVEQEATLLRQGLAIETQGIQARMAPLIQIIVPLTEGIKARHALPSSTRAKIDRLKDLKQASVQSAQLHIDRLKAQLSRVTSSQSRLATIRPVYGSPQGRAYKTRGNSLELRG